MQFLTRMKHPRYARARAAEANAESKFKTTRPLVSTGVLMLGLLITSTAVAQINFQNTTNSALGQFRSETWGTSVGDYNGDFWPDIFVGNHRQRPTIYRNNGDGTFTDVILQVDRSQTMLSNRFIDHHGAAWADFDGDGDDDLQIATNGASPGYLGVSDGTFLDNEASSRGTSNDGSGWAVSWFDVNKDDRIDLGRWSFNNSDIRTQTSSNTFTSGPGIACANTNYGQIADVTGDGFTDLICGPDGTFPRAVYDYSNGAPQSVSTTNGIIIGNSLDTVIADLDGDLENEILSVRGAIFPNQAVSISSTRAEAFMDAATGQGSATFNFSASSAVAFTVYGRNVNGVTTTVQPGTSVTLNAGGIANDGRIDVSSSGNQWTVTTRSGTYAAAYIVMESSGSISNVQVDQNSLRPVDFPIQPRLLKRSGSNWVNQSNAFGFGNAESCAGVVAADFDNDMDLDIYMACRGSVQNIANRMYRNNGNGTFTRITGFGAEGPVGVGLNSGVGSSENAVTLDYDNNGFIDVFVANGLQEQPLRVGGPHTIFRNIGNSNRWIQLKLIGQSDNAPAVGARVLATAGGTTQLREQNGGYHRWSQNDQRIHFGLGSNTTVDLIVEWPNGPSQTFNNVQSNRIYEVSEGGSITAVTPGSVAAFPAPGANDVCGAPTYLSDLDYGVFLYQTNCGSNRWNVRVSGGQPGATFQGRIVAGSGGSLNTLTPTGLEGNDTLTGTASEVNFNLVTGPGGVDGFAVNMLGNACFVIDSPNNVRTMVGSGHLPVPSTGFNPITRQACTPSGGGGTPSLSIADVSVNEDDGTAAITVTRSGNTSGTVTFGVATQNNGNATPGSDFFGRSQSFTLTSGQTTAVFNVTIVDDNAQESLETFGARIYAPSGATVSDGNATISIVDNDSGGGGTPSLVIQNRTFGEGAGLVTVPIVMSQTSSSDVTVQVSTAAETAQGGQDYFGFTRTITIPAGSTSATVSVQLVDNNVAEPTETFRLRIYAPQGATINDAIGQVTIIDND